MFWTDRLPWGVFSRVSEWEYRRLGGLFMCSLCEFRIGPVVFFKSPPVLYPFQRIFSRSYCCRGGNLSVECYQLFCQYFTAWRNGDYFQVKTSSFIEPWIFSQPSCSKIEHVREVRSCSRIEYFAEVCEGYSRIDSYGFGKRCCAFIVENKIVTTFVDLYQPSSEGGNLYI